MLKPKRAENWPDTALVATRGLPTPAVVSRACNNNRAPENLVNSECSRLTGPVLLFTLQTGPAAICQEGGNACARWP